MLLKVGGKGPQNFFRFVYKLQENAPWVFWQLLRMEKSCLNFMLKTFENQKNQKIIKIA